MVDREPVAEPTPEALATADGIDVVHMCTPNHVHAALAGLAPDSGRHVVCEKPLAIGTAAGRAARVATAPCAGDRVEFMIGDRISAVCAQTSTVLAERADREAGGA